MAPDPLLSAEDRAALLAVARDAIAAALSGEPPPAIDPPAALRRRGGIFVTLYSGDELRGCIGTMDDDQPLWCTVARMAVAAAFSDPRFPRLTRAELDRSQIEIACLTRARRARPEDVEPGRHGVCVVRGPHRGVFLPKVASRQGWDRTALLDQVCLKASLPADAWKEPSTEISLFEAESFSEPPSPATH